MDPSRAQQERASRRRVATVAARRRAVRSPEVHPNAAKEFLAWSKQQRGDYHTQLKEYVNRPVKLPASATDAASPARRSHKTRRQYFDPLAVRKAYGGTAPPNVAPANNTASPSKRRPARRPATAPTGASRTRREFQAQLAVAAGSTGAAAMRNMAKLEHARKASAKALAKHIARPAHSSTVHPVGRLASSTPWGRHALQKSGGRPEEVEAAWLGSPTRLLRRVFSEKELTEYFSWYGMGVDPSLVQDPGKAPPMVPPPRPQTAGKPPSATTKPNKKKPQAAKRPAGLHTALSLVMDDPPRAPDGEEPTSGEAKDEDARLAAASHVGLAAHSNVLMSPVVHVPMPVWNAPSPGDSHEEGSPQRGAASGTTSPTPSQNSEASADEAAIFAELGASATEAFARAAAIPIHGLDSDSDDGAVRVHGETLTDVAGLTEASAQHFQGILTKYAARVRYQQDTAGEANCRPGAAAVFDDEPEYDAVADDPGKAMQPTRSTRRGRRSKGARPDGKAFAMPSKVKPKPAPKRTQISLYTLPGKKATAKSRKALAKEEVVVKTPPKRRKPVAPSLKEQLEIAGRVSDELCLDSAMKRQLRAFILDDRSRRSRRLMDADTLRRVMQGMVRQAAQGEDGTGVGGHPAVFKLKPPQPGEPGFDGFIAGKRWVKGLYDTGRVHDPVELQPEDVGGVEADDPMLFGLEVPSDKGVSGYDAMPVPLLLSPVKQAPSLRSDCGSPDGDEVEGDGDAGAAPPPQTPVRAVIDMVRAQRPMRGSAQPRRGMPPRRSLKDTRPTGVRTEHQQAPTPREPQPEAGPPLVIDVHVDKDHWRTQDVGDGESSEEESAVSPRLLPSLRVPPTTVASSILDRKPPPSPRQRRAARAQRKSASRLAVVKQAPSRFRAGDVEAALKLVGVVDGHKRDTTALPPGVDVGAIPGNVTRKLKSAKQQQTAMTMLTLSPSERAFLSTK